MKNFDYTNLTWQELLTKTKDWFNAPRAITEALTRLNNKPSYLPPYKIYRALLTQSGTNAPTAIVLENTLGGNLSFVYRTEGAYTVTSSSLFTLNKTMISFGNVINNANAGTLEVSAQGEDITSSSIPFNVKGDNASANSILLKTPIEIIVYN